MLKSDAGAQQEAPTVSVLMITYNHERFIAQAIESVLVQRTSFRVELVIGEDCSTDSTRAIVEHYASAHPATVRPLLHERNLGMAANARAVAAACRGEFVACLEGDDYWTHSDKLQHQVDFLRSHPECPACFHNAEVVSTEGVRIREFCTPKPSALVQVIDLLEWNLIPTVSLLYRRKFAATFPEDIYKLAMQDWPVALLLASQGPLGFIDEIWAAYRMHGGSAWSAKGTAQKWRHVMAFYDTMEKLLAPSHRPTLRAVAKRARLHLVEALAAEGKTGPAASEAWHYLLTRPRRFRLPPAQRIRFLQRLARWKT